MPPVPDQRYQAVRAAVALKAPPDDAALLPLYQGLLGKPTSEEAAYAQILHTVPEHRAAMDAFILAEVPGTTISATLRIPERVIATYAFFFMDMTVFRNKLEIMSYGADYEGSAWAKELVKCAVTVGPEYLLWTFGSTKDIDTRYVIRRTMVDAFFRGLAHKGNAITSNVAKESQRWWGTAIKNAEVLERIDPHTEKQAHEELRMALEPKDETLKPEESPVPIADILH